MSSLLKMIGMPWLFNNFYPSQTKQLRLRLKNDLLPMTEGFVQAYKGYIQALAANNVEYLQRVTDPRLYAALKTSLGMVRAQKRKLRVLNADAKVLSEFCNPKMYFTDTTS
mmetsp:Transcript_31556/g.54671  ORF Transcript_31556/g.54671 Transcript_31556/m.54671 type:complete len:111 (+) Transcript_31556:13-345(+)